MASLAQPMDNASEEKKDNISYETCHATKNYDANKKLKYIEKEQFLTDEHTKMYNELRLYVDTVLQRKVPWELSILPPKLLALVDPNPIDMEQKENDYYKQKNSQPQLGRLAYVFCEQCVFTNNVSWLGDPRLIKGQSL